MLRLVLAAARQGTSAWDRPFVLGRRGEGPLEYLPAMPAFDYGPGFVLDRFAELVPSLPVHAAGHPPGLLLVMHFLQLDSAARLAAFCIVVGALSAPLTYALGRQLLTEPQARIAGVLAAFSPAMLHFGATSADAVYLTVGLLRRHPAPLQAAVDRRGRACDRLAVRLVAAGGRRVGGDPRPRSATG